MKIQTAGGNVPDTFLSALHREDFVIKITMKFYGAVWMNTLRQMIIRSFYVCAENLLKNLLRFSGETGVS